MCFCSAKFLWFSYLCKLIYSIQLPSASLQLAVCCRRIHGNKNSLHPVGCRSTDNKNTPLHVNMPGASLLSDICSADAVFIKLYSARYHSNSWAERFKLAVSWYTFVHFILHIHPILHFCVLHLKFLEPKWSQ